MKRVLITEDEGIIAEIYRDSFDREGFSAEIARDGAIAIQRLKENPPDVVLLDLMMPNVNGVEVLKYIRSQDALRTLPVIVMSNAFASAMGQEAAKAGATKLIPKNGYGPKRLVKEVQDVLSGGAAPAPAAVPSAGDAALKIADLRKDVTTTLPQRITSVRNLIKAMAGERGRRPEHLLEIHRAVHQVAAFASMAGFQGMDQLAAALEALIKELHAKPQRVNHSSFRTAMEAGETLGVLATRIAQVDDGISSPLILVVDDDPISRETTCSALEQARLRALSVYDPRMALKLADENRFDLVLTDIQMPEMNGFELYEKIHASRANTKTPVIFVTSLSNYETQVRSSSRQGLDFIAKPILLTELAVKALTHLLRAKLS